MNPRTLKVLEYNKILAKVAEQCAFSGGSELALALLPSDDLVTVRALLAQTDEAFRLLEQKPEIHFGGVKDMRPQLEKATRGAMLLAQELLEFKNTLVRARVLRSLLLRLEQAFPHLAELAQKIEPCDHVVSEIGRCINDRSEVVDNASPKLAQTRQALRVAQERLLGTLDKLVHTSDMKPYLQDALITQRQGRYVIPVRSEYKGQVDGIIHDQSASGATLFIEPLKVVQQNNEVREMELQEDKEVRRILTELSELVADEAPYVQGNIQALANLDLTFAKAKYAAKLDAILPEVVPFRSVQKIAPAKKRRRRRKKRDEDQPDNEQSAPEEVLHPGSVIDLHRARHPLLDPHEVVPIDIYLDDETYLIVVTGPNTGGKTVTLKTVGLLTLMAQSGLMIPADPNSKLSIFGGIYADIGDEQSIEQSLSTFSSHMTNIIDILEEADPQCLVLLDELGAGTDPDEGSALAMALLENLRDRGITTFSTTHYSDLKLYAHNTPGVRNASVEFDVESLSPTYELSIGLPGRSNALTIAHRLGLNPVIVDQAKSIVRPDTLEADSLLEDIKRAKQEAYQILENAKLRENQANLVEHDLRYQLANIEEARRTVIAETREIMQRELAEMQDELKQTRRRLNRNSPFKGGKDSHDEFLARAQQEVDRRQGAEQSIDQNVIMPGSPEEQLAGPIEVGDRVWVPSLQASGEVLSINQQTQEADIQLGNFRLKMPLKRLELRQKATHNTTHASASNQITLPPSRGKSPGIALDLRGERVEEGLERVQTYLDQAYMARLPWVRIIHGKGTGVLRDAIRKMLGKNAVVSKFRSGESGEGGDGVTVAHLVEV